jgi:hypothetical protein
MKGLLFIFGLCIASKAFSQSHTLTPEMQDCVTKYNLKINELLSTHQQNGFEILKEQKLPIQSNLDMILHLPLYAGEWYHFSFVGDPSADKIKTTLFLEGYGDIVQDRIKVNRDSEFWTEFSFICPQTGMYELTLYQKCEISRPLSYLTIFKKEKPTSVQEY